MKQSVYFRVSRVIAMILVLATLLTALPLTEFAIPLGRRNISDILY